jgi:hypothetical protein
MQIGKGNNRTKTERLPSRLHYAFIWLQEPVKVSERTAAIT